MPARTFAITADDKPVTLDAKGVGEITITVANTASKPIRGLAKLVPLGTTDGGWLKIQGEKERSYSPGETHQVVVSMTAPASAASGKYPFRLNMMSVQNPDDDFAEGPTLSFEVKAGATPIAPVKKNSWLFLIVLAVLLIGGGVAVMLLLQKKVPMPALAGLTLTDLTNKLNEAKLKLAEVTLVPAGTNQPGTVVSQTPAPATLVKKGAAVTVQLEPALVVVPEVKSQQLIPASQILANARLMVEPKAVTVNTRDSALELHVAKTVPPAGTPVKEGSRVTLHVWKFQPSLPGNPTFQLNTQVMVPTFQLAPGFRAVITNK